MGCPIMDELDFACIEEDERFIFIGTLCLNGL